MGRALSYPVAHIEAGLAASISGIRSRGAESSRRRPARRNPLRARAWAAANLPRSMSSTRARTRFETASRSSTDEPLSLASRSHSASSRSTASSSCLTDGAHEYALGRPPRSRSRPRSFHRPSGDGQPRIEGFGLDRCFDGSGLRPHPTAVVSSTSCASSGAVLRRDGQRRKPGGVLLLDRPCLVHRLRTERRGGLGENAVLSGMDIGVLRAFGHPQVISADICTPRRLTVRHRRRRPRATLDRGRRLARHRRRLERRRSSQSRLGRDGLCPELGLAGGRRRAWRREHDCVLIGRGRRIGLDDQVRAPSGNVHRH